MKKVIEKQTASLAKIESNLSQDKLTQLTKDTQKDPVVEELKAIHAVLKDGLTGDKNKTLNSNILKLSNEVKNQSKTLKVLAKPGVFSAEQTKEVLDKSRERREFKTIGSRMKETRAGVKDFFTGRGFLDKTGISKRGSGGLVSEYLDAREDRQKYAKARIEAGDPTVRLHGLKKSTKIFERQRGEQQSLRRAQGEDERKIASYRELGISEKQIDKSKESKNLVQTAMKFAKSDPALRPEGFDMSKMKQEDTVEAQRSRDSQTGLLEKIEEGISLLAGTAKDKPKTKAKGAEATEGGGVLSGITGFLGEAFMTAIKSMFSFKNILKLLGKVALPAMIIGSLVNGIMDGFNKFMETGSIGDALIAGLGGMLEFLTFGLFDAKTVEKVSKAVSGFMNEFIIDPLINFFKSIKDSVLSMIQSIGIPEVVLYDSAVTGKISVGPFYPFKDTAKPTAAAAVSPPLANANVVTGKSAENASAAGVVSTAPIIVSAPTTNNSTSKQNIAMPMPIRNDDSGYNRYMGNRAVMI